MQVRLVAEFMSPPPKSWMAKLGSSEGRIDLASLAPFQDGPPMWSCPQVSPDMQVAEAAVSMLCRKQDVALVTDGRRVLGMFTTADALRAMSEAFSQAFGDD